MIYFSKKPDIQQFNKIDFETKFTVAIYWKLEKYFKRISYKAKSSHQLRHFVDQGPML